VREAILDAAPGATLVIAEHHLEPWLPHVDRLVVLGPQARIIADGDPASVLRAQPDRPRRAGVLPAGTAAPPATRPGTGPQGARRAPPRPRRHAPAPGGRRLRSPPPCTGSPSPPAA